MPSCRPCLAALKHADNALYDGAAAPLGRANQEGQREEDRRAAGEGVGGEAAAPPHVQGDDGALASDAIGEQSDPTRRGTRTTPARDRPTPTSATDSRSTRAKNSADPARKRPVPSESTRDDATSRRVPRAAAATRAAR